MLVVLVAATGANAPTMLAAALGQLSMLVFPVIAMLQSQRTRAALGLVWPAGRYVLAGVLIGVSAWYINIALVSLIGVPEDQQLVELVDRPTLPVALLVIAVAPAICEEVLFRGVLVRGFATRLTPAPAVVLAAAMFSVYHLRLVQLLPTFTLGLVFGMLALRAGSAIPTMIAHFLNNAIALAVARREAPEVTDVLASYPVATFAVCAALTGAGIGIAAAPRRPT